MAGALQITTDWHEEAYDDPQGQLAAPVLAAAVRNNDHIYELHLICGRDQYDGPAAELRRDAPVLEIAVSAFHENESAAAIAGDDAHYADGQLAIGDMSPAEQRFRREHHANVVSVAFTQADTLSGQSAASRLIAAARAGSQITVGGLVDHETVSLPISTDNDTIQHFLAACPVTAGG